MEPILVTRQAFNVLGIQSRIDPTRADYHGIWEEEYMPHHDVVRKLAKEEGYYGIYFSSEVPGKVDFLAGMAVGDVEIAINEEMIKEYENKFGNIGKKLKQRYKEINPKNEREKMASNLI